MEHNYIFLSLIKRKCRIERVTVTFTDFYSRNGKVTVGIRAPLLGKGQKVFDVSPLPLYVVVSAKIDEVYLGIRFNGAVEEIGVLLKRSVGIKDVARQEYQRYALSLGMSIKDIKDERSSPFSLSDSSLGKREDIFEPRCRSAV